jgi:hypothetical protein
MDGNKKNLDKDQKEPSSQMNKTLYPTRAVIRIIAGFFAPLWIFIGVSPTIIFSSIIQEDVIKGVKP